MAGVEGSAARDMEASYMSTTSGRTGEQCQVSGVYKCSSHGGNEIPLAKGNTFPPCSLGGGHGTVWVLVRRA